MIMSLAEKTVLKFYSCPQRFASQPTAYCLNTQKSKKKKVKERKKVLSENAAKEAMIAKVEN